MKRGVYSKAGPVGANGIVPAGPLVDHRRPYYSARFAAAGASISALRASLTCYGRAKLTAREREAAARSTAAQ